MFIIPPVPKETLIPSVLIKAFKSASKSRVTPVPLNLSLWALIKEPKPANLSLKLLYLSSRALKSLAPLRRASRSAFDTLGF